VAAKRTLEFEILAQTKKATKDLTKLRGELTKLDKKIVSSQKGAKGFSSSFGNLAAITAGFVSLQAAIRGVSSAITTIADFEVQIDKLGAISKASAEDLALMEEEAKRLGETTQYTASQVADAMNFLAMAGFSVNEIMASTQGVLNLATIGMMDLGEAADIASNILTGFGLDAEETDRVVDVLAETITSSNTNVQELGSAMSKVAPVAASLNMSLEETAAALGVMADAGIKAELAGTQLKMALIQLATDSKAKAALKEMGVSAYDAEGKFKGLIQIVKEMKPALSKMSQEARNTALVDVFGKRAVASANIFIDKLDSIEEKYKSNTEAGGVADKMAKQFMDNLSGAYKEFQSALEGVILKFKDILPLLEDAFDGTTEWLRSMDSSRIGTFITAIGDMIAIVKKAKEVLPDLKLPDNIRLPVDVFGPLRNYLDLLGEFKTRYEEMFEASEKLEEQTLKTNLVLTDTDGVFVGTAEDMETLKKTILSLIDENNKLIGQWVDKSPTIFKDKIVELQGKVGELADAYSKLDDGAIVFDKSTESVKKLEVAVKGLADATTELSEEEQKALEKLNEKRVKDHSKTLKTLEKDEVKLSKEILKLNEKLAKDLKKIEDDRLKSKVDIQTQIMELERGALSDKEAYYQKEQDADKLISDAKRALLEGDLEAYKTYSEAAKSLIDENGDKAITKNGAILVSADEVRKNSIESLKELGGLEDQYYDQKKAAAQAAHNQVVDLKKIELDLVKLNIEAELELIKLASQPKGMPIDTAALDAVLAKIDGLRTGLDSIRNTVTPIQTDTTGLDTAKQKYEEIKTLTLNGVTLKVDANTTPADFDIDKLVTTSKGKIITMGVNPEWEKAKKEIETKLKPKPIVTPVKVDAKLFKKEVAAAQKTAKTPVTTPVKADVSPAQTQFRTLKASIAVPSVHKINADGSAAFRVIAQLKQPTSSNHTIYVKKVYTNANGGYAGEPLRRAEGGSTYRRIPHGKIPGHDLTGRDDVRVLATRGEYYMNVRSTDYYGEGLMNAINKMAIPREALMGASAQKLATGGPVGSTSHTISSSRGLGDLGTLTLSVEGNNYPVLVPREVAEALKTYINSEGGL